jgi:hypothetical protein
VETASGPLEVSTLSAPGDRINLLPFRLYLEEMAPLNNPAGRLYGLLESFNEGEGSIADVWAHILEVQAPMVRERLGGVAQLVTQIDAALEAPEMSAYLTTFARHRNDFLETIFPLAHSFNEPADHVKPSKHGIEDLATLAAHLGAVAPEPGPSEEERTKLLDDLQALIDQVEGDTDLPSEIAHLIVRRLLDVELALRHVNIGGPEAVRRATEALIGATVALRHTNENARRATSLRKVFAIAGVIWAAFTGPADVRPSIEAWEGYAHLLDAGPAHVAQTAPHRAGVAVDPDEVVDAEVVPDADGAATDADHREGSVTS